MEQCFVIKLDYHEVNKIIASVSNLTIVFTTHIKVITLILINHGKWWKIKLTKWHLCLDSIVYGAQILTDNKTWALFLYAAF